MSQFLGVRVGIVTMLALASAACDNAGEGRVLGIDAEGRVAGQVFFDGDGSGKRDSPEDVARSGIRVRLVPVGANSPAATLESDTDGLLRATDLPVGRYLVRMDTNTFSDTLVVIDLQVDTLTLDLADTTFITVGVSYPTLVSSAIDTSRVGRRAFVTGVALNAVSAFGDSTLHVIDTAGVVRAVRVRPLTIGAGDSVRVRGTVGVRDGVQVLDDVRAFVVSAGIIPPAESLATGIAATADGGRLAGALVRVAGAPLIDSSIAANGDGTLRVDDGSGVLRVVLDVNQPISLGPYVLAGATIRSLGVLVPDGTGGWLLKPRSQADIQLTVPVSTLADVRNASLGTKAFIDGIALNSRETFGDTTVHVASGGSAIRAVRVARLTMLPGDSVRFHGTVSTRDGQVVLANVTPFIVLAGLGDPPALDVTTATAASANGSALDAALVRVRNVSIVDTATVSGGFRMNVDDGAGPLEVFLDSDVLTFNPTLYDPGDLLDVRGLLVPTGSGTWLLKPRFPTDIVEK